MSKRKAEDSADKKGPVCDPPLCTDCGAVLHARDVSGICAVCEHRKTVMSKRAKLPAPAIDAAEHAEEDTAFALQFLRDHTGAGEPDITCHPSKRRQLTAVARVAYEATTDVQAAHRVCTSCAVALLRDVVAVMVGDRACHHICRGYGDEEACECWCQRQKQALLATATAVEAALRPANAGVAAAASTQ